MIVTAGYVMTLAVRDIQVSDSVPEPVEIIESIGLGDYVVRFEDGEMLTVNVCDIWDSLDSYEEADDGEV